MKKVTTIRQNRCDREMNFFVFLCFALFLAMQLLVSGKAQTELVNRVNMALYIVFVPGFFLRLGYRYNSLCRLNSEEYRKKWLLKEAGRYFVYFFLLSFVNEACNVLSGSGLSQKKEAIIAVLADVLSFFCVPSVAAVFLSLTMALLLIWGFENFVHKLSSNKKKMAVVGFFCLLCAFLRSQTESYAFMAALLGSDVQPSVSGIPYFAFFLFGMYLEDKKPGFQGKIAVVTAVATIVSVLLYRTPAQDLCRVIVSFLPAYVLYLMSEGLSELTLRFKHVDFACSVIEPVFGVYAVLMFGLHMKRGIVGDSIPKTLLVAGICILLLYVCIFGFQVCSRLYASLSRFVQQKVKHKTAFYFLVYTAAFSFLLFLTFFEFARTGTSFIINGDGVSQYFPRIIYFSRYIKELFANILRGNFQLPMYDFRIGLGTEITYSLEPLYFIYALFDESHMEFAYNLVTVLRFYLAGVSMSIFCLYFKKDYFSTFLASVVYVICGFALYGGSMHTMFMIPMIMLPLLILSMEEIIRKKRWYLCTIFVAISLFSNYYFLYMNTIAMGVYFLVRFFCQKEKGKKTVKNFFSRAAVICGSYLLGVAMSCIVLVTTFGMYLGSGRTSSAVIKMPSMLFYRAEWLLSCFLTFITTANSPGEWLKLGFLPIALIAVVFLFLRKGRKELKIFSFVVLIFMAFPVFGFIFSGFSTPINRWCYMASFLVAFLVADCYRDMCRMEKREMQICGGVVLLYGFLAFFAKYKSTIFAQIGFVLLVLTFAVLLICQEGYKKVTLAGKKCLMLVLTAVLVFYQGYSLFHMEGRIRGYAPADTALEEVIDTPLAAVEEVGDDSFYRCAVPYLKYYNSNAPFLLDYNSNTNICSTFNGNIMEYLEMMGSTDYSITQLLGMGNRTFLNNLASVKYYATYENPKKPLAYGSEEILKTTVNDKETTVYENKYALPLGYTYEEAVSEEELEQYDVLERQEVLMQKVLLSASEDTGNSDAVISGKTLPILSKEEDGAQLEDHALIAGDGVDTSYTSAEEGSFKLTLYFSGEENAETYLVLKNALLEGDMSEEPIKLTIMSEGSKYTYSFVPDDYRYKTGQKDFVFNLGYHEDAITSCTVIMGREGTIQFDSLEIYSQPMDNLADYTEKLTENVLENIEVGTNEVTGTISLNQEKTLVLSIPYQNGWKAYVDGEETELLQANYMYMALPLEAGDHTIKLTFEIPGVKYALVIMPGAVVVLIVLCFISWLLKKRKKKAAKQ